MKFKAPLVDKYLQPLGTPGNNPPQQKYIPWSWGVMQGVQLKKIRSSTGYFKKLSAGIVGSITSITGGTINTSTINVSTITNSNFQGTLSQPVSTGGTFTNPTVTTGTLNTSLFNTGTLGTPSIVGGTFNNGVVGTPAITGGTYNNGVIGTPAVTGGTYTALNLGGTASYPVTSGTQALSSNNMFQFQTYQGSAVLVVRSGGTNFMFINGGTF